MRKNSGGFLLPHDSHAITAASGQPLREGCIAEAAPLLPVWILVSAVFLIMACILMLPSAPICFVMRVIGASGCGGSFARNPFSNERVDFDLGP
jgi:hypothetical protein